MFFIFQFFPFPSHFQSPDIRGIAKLRLLKDTLDETNLSSVAFRWTGSHWSGAKKKNCPQTPPSLMTVPVEPCHPPNHLPQSPRSTSATFRSKLMPALLLWSPASCIWVTLLPSSQAQERQSAFPAEKMHEDLQKHFALWVSFGTFYFNSQQINPTRFLNLSGPILKQKPVATKNLKTESSKATMIYHVFFFRMERFNYLIVM